MRTTIVPYPTRRSFLKAVSVLASAGALYTTPGLFAAELQESLVRTPRQTEGPFYPDKLPLDTDNDLLVINDSITPAVGDVTHLSGRILDARGAPVRNALIEIWQVDNRGGYIHSRGARRESDRDKNFQGFGRFLTGSTGEYYFRTIKPVTYPGRTPHIHVKVKRAGKELLTTQFFIKGHPQNDRDGVVNEIRDRKQRESVTLNFTKIPNSPTGELAAKGDIVLGWSPEA